MCGTGVEAFGSGGPVGGSRVPAHVGTTTPVAVRFLSASGRPSPALEGVSTPRSWRPARLGPVPELGRAAAGTGAAKRRSPEATGIFRRAGPFVLRLSWGAGERLLCAEIAIFAAEGGSGVHLSRSSFRESRPSALGGRAVTRPAMVAGPSIAGHDDPCVQLPELGQAPTGLPGHDDRRTWRPALAVRRGRPAVAWLHRAGGAQGQ